MASLYANENFPLRVVKALRRLGHGVLTTREAARITSGSQTTTCWGLPATLAGL